MASCGPESLDITPANVILEEHVAWVISWQIVGRHHQIGQGATLTVVAIEVRGPSGMRGGYDHGIGPQHVSAIVLQVGWKFFVLQPQVRSDGGGFHVKWRTTELFR